MNRLKGWITPTALAIAIALTGTSANAGIIVGNALPTTNEPTCKQLNEKIDWGIIVGNLTGIIVGNLTGIIVGNVIDSPVQKCG